MSLRRVSLRFAVWLAAITACGGRSARLAAADGDRTTGESAGDVAMPPAVYPLTLAPNRRHLVDRDGRPFLLLGDSAWNLFVSLTVEEATDYLEDRRARGFNAALVQMIENKFSAAPPKNAYGVAPFTATLPGTSTPDFSTPNEPYFAHVDRVMAIAAGKGIFLEVTPAYLGYGGGDEGWYRQMKANGPARLAAYGAYLGNRYKRFANIIWVDGGDTDPTVRGIDPAYTRALAAAIKAADPDHLHTVHGHPGRSVLDAWAGESWIDVATIYTYPAVVNRVPVHVKALAERARPDAKPFFLIESTYEGDRTYRPTSQLVRQQAYEALLSGAAGENFGNDPLWRFGAGWRSALASHGTGDMTRLARLFAPRAWYDLVPDAGHTFLTAGFGSGRSYVPAALTEDGKLGLAYIPGGSAAIVVDMARVKGRITARWYDPTNGTFHAVSGARSTSAESFAPPGRNAAGDADWVFVLESD